MRLAEQSRYCRYSTNHQVVADADTRVVVVVGRPLPGNRADCKAREGSGAKVAVGKTTTIAGGGWSGTGLVMPNRRRASTLGWSAHIRSPGHAHLSRVCG